MIDPEIDQEQYEERDQNREQPVHDIVVFLCNDLSWIMSRGFKITKEKITH